jgi:hypothetical protein
MSHISENLEQQEGVREICLSPSFQASVSDQHNSGYTSKAFPLRTTARWRERDLKYDNTAAKE